MKPHFLRAAEYLALFALRFPSSGEKVCAQLDTFTIWISKFPEHSTCDEIPCSVFGGFEAARILPHETE